MINSNKWKAVFGIISIIILFLMPILSQYYGQNGDENIEIIYGQDIYNYFAKGDMQAVNYDNHPMTGNIKGLQFYGGMFDLMTEAVHRVNPSWHIVSIRHIFSSIFGSLLFIFTGLLAYRLSGKKWHIGVLALLFVLFSPRLFGESMNNGKDIPFATGFVMGVYFLDKFLENVHLKINNWWNAIFLGLSWAIVFGMRASGGLIFVAYVGLFVVVYYLLNKEKRTELFAGNKSMLKTLLIQLIAACIGGYIIGIFTWPYGLQAPIENMFIALKEMTNRSVGIRVLFDGVNVNSMEMPWYYEFKWILYTNPVIVLLASMLFVALFFYAKKEYGFYTFFILVFSALFPILYIIYKNSTVYDTWRHVFFVYPFWVICAALTVPILENFLKEKLKMIPFIILIIGLIPSIIWTVKSHPNQYVYFNEFAGGMKGAFGNFDLDYYHNTGKQSAEWILKNAKRPPAGKKLIVLTNMDGMDTYFRNDTSWIYTDYARYYERNQKKWDYYVSFDRFVSPWQLQNGRWPPNHVFDIKVDGVTIGIIMQRNDQSAVEAYNAMEKKDFTTAINLYSKAVKDDPTDEFLFVNFAICLANVGRFDDAVANINYAISRDGSRAEFYQLLSQIYNSQGKTNEANNALRAAQNIMLQQQ